VKSRVPHEPRGSQPLRGRHLCAVALVVAMALLLVPADASAVSPVLEFVVPGHSLPVSFATESGAVSAEMAGFESLVHCTASHGEGEITGPRSTVSEYRLTGCVTERGSHEKCKSAGASQEEIRTGPIDAELVYIDQAGLEVGMLLNPGGGTYIAFECGGVSAEGQGPFLAPVGPINQEATSFTATLSQLDSVQTPDGYENEKGERLQAIPTGRKGTDKFVPTGVEAAFTVHPVVPVEIKAVTAGEIEAKQHEEEAKKQEETLQKQEATLQKQEATLKKQEEALKKAEEHAKQIGEEAKKHEEALNAQIAAIKKHLEEEAAKKKQEESKPPTRAQLLSKALTKCKKQPKNKRAQCVAEATKKYGHKAKKKAGKK
jgi:hypothetical protein